MFQQLIELILKRRDKKEVRKMTLPGWGAPEKQGIYKLIGSRRSITRGLKSEPICLDFDFLALFDLLINLFLHDVFKH